MAQTVRPETPTMEKETPLRKHLDLQDLLQHRHRIEDADYWRRLNPQASITDFLLQESHISQGPDATKLAFWRDQLREEGYFQTGQLIPTAMVEEMRRCIDVVKEAGFPVMFALVYDVFYSAFAYLDPVLVNILGPSYKLIPNFWVYFINPLEGGTGFEPHRDAEYKETIGADGLPTVLTLWITITDATPLNSCMYALPKHRDAGYAQAVHDLNQEAPPLALEDIRALPTRAGTLSCWDQYLYHWGSRSSKRASGPRISYAMYCQCEEVPQVDDVAIDLRSGLDFNTRLGLICKGMYRYSYMSVNTPAHADPLRTFLEKHMASLSLA